MEISEIMTVTEVITRWPISRATVCRLALAGKLPGQRVGNKWFLHRESVEKAFLGNKYKAA